GGAHRALRARLDGRRRVARAARGQEAPRRREPADVSGDGRRPLIVGNWKMHKTVAESVAFARAIREEVTPAWRAEVMVAPVFTALYSVGEALRGSAVGLAAQNVHDAPSGAFTGEVSASQLADVGCTHVIL